MSGRFDHIVEVGSARYDYLEEVAKGNPYHDPKTGRFTTGPGGAGSFSPAGTIAEAREYAKTALGFSGRVDYSYSYIDQQEGRQVSGTLDIATVNHINKSITEIQARYPELKGYVQNLECTDSRVYAQLHHDGRDATPSLRIGAKVYKDGVESVYRKYAEDVDLGYHPKGTTGDAILWHEYGHVYASMANEKACGSNATARAKLDAIRLDVAESGWKDAAVKKMMGDSSLKQEHDMLGLDFSAQSVAESFGKHISRYATSNNAELFAEAFAAHNTGTKTKWTDALMEAAGARRN